jgi:hypothetical protein
MSSHTTSRLGAASGIAYVVGVLFLNSLDSSKNLVLGAEILALLLFAPFLAYLCSVLRDADRSGGWLPATAFAAGIVALAVKLAGVLPAILVEQGGLTPPVADALTRFGDVSFMVAMMPLGVLVAAVAAVTVRSRALPAWLGWSGAAVAPLLVANGFDLGADFGPAFLLFLLWTLTAAIVLLRRAVTAPAPAPAAATPA